VPVYFSCGALPCPAGYVPATDPNICMKVVKRYPIPQTATSLPTTCRKQSTTYSYFGSYIYSSYNRNGTYINPSVQIDPNNTFWIGNDFDSVSGPLNRCGVWTCTPSVPALQWRGFTTKITAPTTKTYYVGLAANYKARLVVNGDTIISTDPNAMGPQYQDGLTRFPDRAYLVWHIYPVNLQGGLNTIMVEGMNLSTSGALGAEIYDNTPAELQAATSYDDLKLLFSTKDFVGLTPMSDSHGLTLFTPLQCAPGLRSYTDESGINYCVDTLYADKSTGINQVFNPYYRGVLGNWRQQYPYVFQVNRASNGVDPNVLRGTDIRHAGAYTNFFPFWSYSSGQGRFIQNAQFDPMTDTNWVWSAESRFYNQKGLELESRDALDRYSAAQFGYLQSLPVAVGANTKFREMAYDGFEDYGFGLDCATFTTCSSDHLGIRDKLDGVTIKLDPSVAHSGKNSLYVGTNLQVRKSVYSPYSNVLFNFDANGRYLLQQNELVRGFSPYPDHKYIISLWVKDNQPRSVNTNFQIRVNGNSLLNSGQTWPVVEGWKRIETSFTIPATASSLSLELDPGGSAVRLDDIRLHPFDGQMKSYAYDNASLRLWAEMDENNFATFYEYDDEGTLVRVKKETERGIMTIKETRSFYRKNGN
jgi:hypothetical protein